MTKRAGDEVVNLLKDLTDPAPKQAGVSTTHGRTRMTPRRTDPENPMTMTPYGFTAKVASSKDRTPLRAALAASPEPPEVNEHG